MNKTLSPTTARGTSARWFLSTAGKWNACKIVSGPDLSRLYLQGAGRSHAGQDALRLSKEELCVCDMAALFGVTRSAISSTCFAARFTAGQFRREGKVVYYSLDDEHVTRFLRDGLDHVREFGVTRML